MPVIMTIIALIALGFIFVCLLDAIATLLGKDKYVGTLD
jgi:hypothetical protein